MRLLLLRHGETNWNLERRCQGVTDLALNRTGRQQAREIALQLKGERIRAIYSSSLKRAVETATAVGKSHGLEVTTDDDLRELNHGEFEGLTFSQIRAAYPEFIEVWRKQPAHIAVPGGESLADVDSRVWKGIERIGRRHPGETVVAVSHHFPILAVLCRITGTPLNDYRAFHVEPCGLTRLGYQARQGWSLLQDNDASSV